MRTSNPISVNLRCSVWAFFVVVAWLLNGCAPEGPSIENIQSIGELRVALVRTPDLRAAVDGKAAGFDYVLLTRFASAIDTPLNVRLVESAAEAKRLAAERKVHIAAGSLYADGEARDELASGPSYATVRDQLIYLTDQRRPEQLADLDDAVVWVPRNYHANGLPAAVADAGSPLNFKLDPDVDAEGLLARLATGEIEYAVVPSHLFDLLRGKFPALGVAFDVGWPRAQVWMTSAYSQSIQKLLDYFFAEALLKGQIDSLWNQFYAPFESFDPVDARAFVDRHRERLPEYRAYFKTAGAQFGFDWRLLAAMGYQESHWDNEAKSPTGVRGLMMLTERTAKQLRVSRSNPGESVHGGSRYLADLRERLPASIAEPERTLFALAAYNVGLGHLEDARVLAERGGLDPNAWSDVRRELPLLADPEVAKVVRHGRARGGQAVHFVDNVQHYFHTLTQLERPAPRESPIPAWRRMAALRIF